MSMLEWPTTTTDAEVTYGRQLNKMITISSTKNKEWWMIFERRLKFESQIWRNDEDVKQPWWPTLRGRLLGTKFYYFIKSRSFVIIGCLSYYLLTFMLCYKFTRLKLYCPWASSPHEFHERKERECCPSSFPINRNLRSFVNLVGYAKY